MCNYLKKAIVVGGSNGIGLAISQVLLKKGYHIVIIDKDEPDTTIYVDSDRFTYIYSDLNYIDINIFESLSADDSIEVLMITAGFGRVADFKYVHTKEIDKLLNVNTVSGIKIIKCFYNRICSSKPFYSGMMGSIAGLVSSPLFSVYSASKAAICKFIESVNIEIEQAGFSNRILNVSPGSIKGSKFNGGVNQFHLMEDTAEKIVYHLLKSDELYIPNYEKIYKDVLKRYRENAHEFGTSSYHFKKNSGRLRNDKFIKIGYLSGTFDLFHIGHLNLLERAKNQCDCLIVGIHPDALHKGKETYIPFDERQRIVSSCKYVDKVVKSCPEDSDAWELWHYDKLFVGSDYKGTKRFKKYEEFFKDKDVDIIYFPYTKSTSSTQIRNAIMDRNRNG